MYVAIGFAQCFTVCHLPIQASEEAVKNLEEDVKEKTKYAHSVRNIYIYTIVHTVSLL